MIENENYLSNRILPDVYLKDELDHIRGLVDITEFLFVELIKLLEIEDRCFGIVKDFIARVRSAYSVINEEVTDKEMETFDRILFLYKPLILKEYLRLKKKHLSPADSCITLIHKLLGIIFEYKDFKYLDQISEIKSVIDRLWGNIRNRSKNDPLFFFSNIVRDQIKLKSIGKFELSRITLMFSDINNSSTKEISNEARKTEIDLIKLL